MKKSSLATLKGLVVIFSCFTLMGCSGFGKKLKGFLGGKPVPEKSAASAQPHSSKSYNSGQIATVGPRRQYKRMTKRSIEEESALSDKAGSLWVMEGQGAYLFSQNIIRLIGDPIAIKIDGEPKQQLESKVGVITKLLKSLEARRLRRQRMVAAAKQEKESSSKKKKSEKSVAKKGESKAPQADDSQLNVKSVPTRIIERMVDGNYRIKGSQPFLIGSREYKVIVTGVVRAEDFSEDGINASKLIDSKFDIVSVRKKSSNI
jgi:flagellar L-ring protein precursor FlgH